MDALAPCSRRAAVLCLGHPSPPRISAFSLPWGPFFSFSSSRLCLEASQTVPVDFSSFLT